MLRLPEIDHVLITRFNIPTPGREGLIRAQDGWLVDRVKLFEKYCSPSVKAQSLQSFHWLVYFDPESPQWFKDWLSEQKSTRRFHPVFRTAISHGQLVADLQQLTGAQGRVLLTTNLDNDDGLAVDFVQRLQQSVVEEARHAIYLTQGIILKGNNTYLRSDRDNAFCSVAEPWSNPVTAWTDWHTRLGLTMPVQEVDGPPAWLQVIHDRNVSNRVHGKLVDPSGYTSLFHAILHDVPVPKQTQLLLENFLVSPMRIIKSSLRYRLKSALLGVLGKHRFDVFKNHAARVAHRLRKIVQDAGNPPWSQANAKVEE